MGHFFLEVKPARLCRRCHEKRGFCGRGHTRAGCGVCEGCDTFSGSIILCGVATDGMRRMAVAMYRHVAPIAYLSTS